MYEVHLTRRLLSGRNVCFSANAHISPLRIVADDRPRSPWTSLPCGRTAMATVSRPPLGQRGCGPSICLAYRLKDGTYGKEGGRPRMFAEPMAHRERALDHSCFVLSCLREQAVRRSPSVEPTAFSCRAGNRGEGGRGKGDGGAMAEAIRCGHEAALDKNNGMGPSSAASSPLSSL